MNSSEKVGSLWSTSIIACLSMRTRLESSMVVAVAMHTSCPARHPSPKIYPAPASRPRLLCLVGTRPRA